MEQKQKYKVMKTKSKTLIKLIVMIEFIVSFACSNKQSTNNQSFARDTTYGENFEQISNNTELPDKNHNSKETKDIITYRNLTLEEAYPKFCKDYPEIAKHLPKELTSEDKTYTSNIDNENVEIIYRPLVDEDGLYIKLSYPDGVITVNLEYTNDGICVRINK